MPLTDPLAVHAGAGLAGLLLSAFLLGVLHGVTPDEHTWPITLSYAIGVASDAPWPATRCSIGEPSRASLSWLIRPPG